MSARTSDQHWRRAQIGFAVSAAFWTVALGSQVVKAVFGRDATLWWLGPVVLAAVGAGVWRAARRNPFTSAWPVGTIVVTSELDAAQAQQIRQGFGDAATDEERRLAWLHDDEVARFRADTAQHQADLALLARYGLDDERAGSDPAIARLRAISPWSSLRYLPDGLDRYERGGPLR